MVRLALGRRAGVVLAGALALGVAAASAAQTGGPTVLTVEQWRADLRFLVEKVETEHRNPWARVSRTDFQQAAGSLEARIPSLADSAIVIEMAALVAMLGDGHSRLSLPMADGEAQRQAHGHTPAPAEDALLMRRYPVLLHLFDDGLYVTGATADHVDLVGLEVIRFGAQPVAEALRAVRRVVNADNEQWHKLMGPHLLGVADVCHASGLVGDPERLTLVVRDAAGVTREASLVPLARRVAPKYVMAYERPGAKVAMWLAQRQTPQWFRYLPEHRALFVQVNEVRDAPGKSMAQFAGEVQAFIEEKPVERVIVDLRWNGGGNNYLNRSLVLALARSRKVNRFGGVFTLISRYTFSAAMNLVSQMELLTNTLFAGEPTGSTPSHFGDARRFTLPSSGLTLRLSSIYWRDWNVNEKRPWVAPDLPVALGGRDFLEGRDPVLDAVLAFRAPERIGDQLLWVFRQGGVDAAARRLYFLQTDPVTASADFFAELRHVGRTLLDEGRAADAVRVFQQNLRLRPAIFEAHLDLGESQLAAGSTQDAIASLEKALAIRPGDARVVELLDRARGR